MQAPSIQQRQERRSNIFVIATLYTAAGSTPVRIRNMSGAGALIEGAVLPPVGAAVRLARGSMATKGEIVWLDDGRAGVRFSPATNLADWLPTGKTASAQQLADEVAFHARLGALSNSLEAAPLQSPAEVADLADELRQIGRSLERAGEALASDVVVASFHAASLQVIDAAAQSLAKLAEASASGDCAASELIAR
jgi:PilZ domain